MSHRANINKVMIMWTNIWKWTTELPYRKYRFDTHKKKESEQEHRTKGDKSHGSKSKMTETQPHHLQQNMEDFIMSIKRQSVKLKFQKHLIICSLLGKSLLYIKGWKSITMQQSQEESNTHPRHLSLNRLHSLYSCAACKLVTNLLIYSFSQT